MTNREATYPCCDSTPARRPPSARGRPRMTLRLWLYRTRLHLLCRLAFAGRRRYHAS